MEVKSFAAEVPVFTDRKERPEEAPFMALEKTGTPARTCNEQLEQLLKKSLPF